MVDSATNPISVDPDVVGHPLWTRFLRWCTIRPKFFQTPSSDDLADPPKDVAPRDVAEQPYQYEPLPDPLSFIRLATLLPGDFEDEIAITLDSYMLKPPSRQPPARLTLADIRKDLPRGWEAFQTITEHKYFFRNVQTGRVQWEHPDPGFHIELYQIPPRNDGVVPEYETVSYVWGEPARQKTIRVDTSNGSYAMKVTESLATVLRYLRRPQHTRRLWVDAICLDQDDHAELSRQVPRMRDIYNLAKKATLWLGIADSSSSHAMGRLRYLGDQVTAEADTGVLFPAPGADQDDWYDPTVPLPFPPQTWDAISDLLQRPWFHRLWVVQEIQPGAVVQCGHDQTPVTAITEAIYCMYSKRRLPRGLRRHLEQAVGTLARLPALAFTRLLYRVSTFKACTDPRDKIYGLLGLAPDKFASQMRVSYEESTSAADVFAQAFLNHALICQRLEHFHNCFTHTNLTEGAPSWVPDWWSNIPGETYIPAMFASGTSCAHFTYTSAVGEDGKERPTILRVRGKQCGIVTSTTEPLPPGLGQSEAIRRVRAWQPEDLDSSTYEPTGESTAKHTPSP